MSTSITISKAEVSELVSIIDSIRNEIELLGNESRDESTVVRSVHQLGANLKDALEITATSKRVLNEINTKVKSNLYRLHLESANISENLGRSMSEKNKLEATKIGLESQVEDLGHQISETQEEMIEAREEAEKEKQRRIDGGTDLIPGVGFIGGLVTGRYERMIPYYSQVKAVESLASQRVENLLKISKEKKDEFNRKSDEVHSLNQEIRKSCANIENKERQLKKLRTKETECEKAIKETGKLLTDYENVKKNLMLVAKRTNLLETEIENLKEFEMLDPGEFKGLLPLHDKLVSSMESILLITSKRDTIGYHHLSCERIELTTRKVKHISIYGGYYVDSVTFSYHDGSVKKFGGNGGELKAELYLHDDEEIVSVEGNNINNVYMGGEVKITTSKNRSIEYLSPYVKDHYVTTYIFKSTSPIIGLDLEHTGGSSYLVKGIVKVK